MQSTPFRVRHGIIVETSSNTSTAIVANNQVLTGSASSTLVDLATAWNTTGNPTAIKLNVTNTASGANSALMDLQVSGNSRFYVSANGNIGIGTTSPTSKVEVVGASGQVGLTVKRGDYVTDALRLLNPNGFNLLKVYEPSINEAAITFGAASGGTTISSSGGTLVAAYYRAVYGTWYGTTDGVYGVLGGRSSSYLDFYSGSQIRMTLAGDGNLSLGITTVPNAKLTLANGTSPTSQHIYGTYTDASNYERINLTANSSGHYIIGQQAGTGSARPLYLGANNATMVTVAASGNFGIGTSTPDAKLTVKSSITNRVGTPGLRVYGDVNYIGMESDEGEGPVFNTSYSNTGKAVPGSFNFFTGATKLAGIGTAGIFSHSVNNTFSAQSGLAYLDMWNGSSGDTSLVNISNYNIILSTNNTERMRITGTGNVGIGITTPTARLAIANSTSAISTHIYGTYTDASNYERLNLTANSSGHYIIGQQAGTGSARPLYLGSNNDTMVTVAASGSVGIGTTTPGYKLHVTGSGSQDIYISSLNNDEAGLRFAGAGTRGRIYTDGSYNMIIQPNAQYTNPYVIMKAENDSVNQIRVGINTTSPDRTLHVNGTARISSVLTMGSYIQGTTQLDLYGDSTSSVGVRINATGNVGIGVTSPSSAIDVNGKITTRFGGALRGYFGAPSWDTSYISMQHALLTESASNAAIHQSSGGDTTVNAAVGRSLLLRINNDSGGQGQLEFTNRKFVFSGSNVAIGMTAPTAKFTIADGTSPTSQHIYGTYTDASNYERLNFTANSSGHYIIGQQAGTGSPRNLFLGANNATAVTIDTAGNIGIGTTSPLQKLHISGGHALIGGTYGLYFNDGTTARIVYDQGQYRIHGIGSTIPIVFLTNNTERMRIDANGNVGIGTTAPTAKLHVAGDTTISGNVIIDNALTITQSSLTTSANISTTGVVSTNELVLSNTNVAALHRSPNAITALNIYDTSKDSDGGAWTEKCQGTSWYNEPLAGKWLYTNDPRGIQSEADARRIGCTVGNELITNGAFDGSASWTVGSNWAISNGTAIATAAVYNTNNLDQSISLIFGKIYRVTFNVTSYSAGSIRIDLPGLLSVITGGISAVGSYTAYFTAPSNGSVTLRITGNTGSPAFTGTIDNISVREVTALTTASNDYFQLSTDGKFYRLYKNLLKASGDVTNSIWLKAATTILSGQTALDGSTTAFKLVENTANNSHELYQNGLVYFTNTFYATTVYAKASGRTKFRIQIQNNGGNATQWEFDLTAVTATNTYSAWTGHGATITDVGSGWYRCTLYGQSPAIAGTYVIMSFQLSNGTNSYTGDGTSGVLFWRPQVELSNAFTSYEETSATWEIFRGNKADFPRLAAIVAEGGVIGGNNITIYDLTEPGRPMWMRFFGDGANYTYDFLPPYPISSFAILNGVLAIGISYADLAYYGHLYLVDFPADTLKGYEGYYGRGSEYLGGISLRQETTTSRTIPITTPYYPSGDIRAIAMTVLPDAPMDPVTGLKVPTIALATGAGVSIIKHNGTAVTMTHQDYKTTSVTFLENEKIAWGADFGGNSYASYFHINKIPSVTTDYGPYYNPTAGLEFYAARDWGGGSPTIRFADSDSYMLKTVLANQKNKVLLFSNYYSTKVHGVQRRPRATGTGGSFTIDPTYNTGWMTGDIRRAYLSDVTAEAVAANIQNEDFSSYADNAALRSVWSSGTPANISLVGGKMQIAVASTWVARSWSTVIGRVYRISVTVASGVSPVIRRGSNVSGTQYGQFNAIPVGTARFSFLATGTNFWASAYASPTLAHEFSSFVLEEVVADRSYKAALANINGTISRAKVANNTSLVGYSGFSTSNYLREPYSADLDFGTGEFTASAWVNIPATLPANSFTIISSNLYTGLTPEFADGNGSAATWNAATSTATVTTSGGSYPYLRYNVTSLSTSRAYEVEVQLTSNSSLSWASVVIWLGWTNGQNLNSSGYAKFIIMPTDGITYISLGILGTPPYSVTVQTLSIREVAIASIADRAYSSGSRIQLGFNGAGKFQATVFDGANTRTVITASTYNIAQWLKAEANYTTEGSLSIRVNGREVAVTRGAPLLTLNSKYNLLQRTEQFDNAAWNKDFGGFTITTGVADPNGGTTAVTLTASANGSRIYQQAAGVGAALYTPSIWVRRRSGTGNINWEASSVGLGSLMTITSSWQKISLSVNHGFTDYYFGLRIATAGDEIDIAFADLRRSALDSLPYQRVGAATDFDFAAPLTIGNNYAANTPFPGSIALLKLGATVPTYEQSQFMYDQEKQLFRANAISVLPDTGAIVDMAYDDATDRWAAVSATNESYWNGLIRNSVTPSPAGSYTKISTTSGVELVSRSTTNPGVDVSIPAYGLREELVKRSESAARLTKELIVLDYVGGFTASTTNGSTSITSVTGLTYPTSYIGAVISGSGIPANTTIVAVSGTTIYLSASSNTTSSTTVSFLDFKLPVGMETKTVMVAGTVKQEGATKDYTRLYDGFIETIRFGVAPGTAAWVQIQATKGNV